MTWCEWVDNVIWTNGIVDIAALSHKKMLVQFQGGVEAITQSLNFNKIMMSCQMRYCANVNVVSVQCQRGPIFLS